MLVMLPHISKAGDTTHEASFHATDCIMLSVHAVLMAARSKKEKKKERKKKRYFPITTIKTSYSRIITAIQDCVNTNSTQ